MSNKETKNIDDLVKKMMASTSPEKPSLNFTDTVMSQIYALNTSKAFVYKPLISKSAWVFIAIGFVAVIFFVVFISSSEPSGWLKVLNNTLSDLKFTSFKISKTAAYAFILLGLMVCVQVSLLKHHIDKRYKY